LFEISLRIEGKECAGMTRELICAFHPNYCQNCVDIVFSIVSMSIQVPCVTPERRTWPVLFQYWDQDIVEEPECLTSLTVTSFFPQKTVQPITMFLPCQPLSGLSILFLIRYTRVLALVLDFPLPEDFYTDPCGC
jgi:hypothetical protein